MKISKNIVTLILTICTFFATQAFALKQDVDKSSGVQSQKEETTTGQSQTNEAMQQGDRVSKIIGKPVISQKGEDLGKIEDIVLSKEGCLDYAILSTGGLFGAGDHLIPIPWKAVTTSPQADKIIVSMDKSQLEKAPNFESKKWPNLAGSEWYAKIRDFFGGQ